MAKTFYVNGDLGRAVIVDTNAPVSAEFISSYDGDFFPESYAEYTYFHTSFNYLQLTSKVVKASATFSSLAPDTVYWDTGGCDCFSADTLVDMADGTKKRIAEIKTGEKVLGENGNINTVTFVEAVLDSVWGYLYSPDPKIDPFITVNHPVYIDGKLCGPDAKNIESIYPWLGEISPLNNTYKVPAKGDIVYNLWLTGDAKYYVNGYLTHSIMYDGAFLSYSFSKSWLSQEEVLEIMTYFTCKDRYLQYGAYLVNNLLMKIKPKILLKYVAKSLAKENGLARWTIKHIGKVLGRVLHPYKETK